MDSESTVHRTFVKHGWIVVVILWAAALTSIAAIADRTVPLASNMTRSITNGTAYPLERWDVQFYLHVATSGYMHPEDAAFFPTFPALLGMFHGILPIILPWLGAGLSLACLIGALALMRNFRVVRAHHLETWVVVVALTVPTAFVFIIPYSESLFLFLSALLYWLLEHRKFSLATLTCVAATLTRPFGIVLVVPIVMALIKERRLHVAAIAAFTSVTALALWSFVLDHIMHRTLSFFHATTDSFQHKLEFPVQLIFGHLNNIFLNPHVIDKFLSFNIVLGVVAAVTGLIGAWRFFGKTWFFMALSATVISYVGSYINSDSRHVFSLFPILIGLVAITPKRLRPLLAIASVAILVINTVLFARWYFVV